jgi:hypothetical protein
MQRWRYHVTMHAAEDILALLPQPAGDVPPAIFCDSEGACYFDAGPNPLTQAVEALLNQRGSEGWELVQLSFRPQQMVGFWKQRAD